MSSKNLIKSPKHASVQSDPSKILAAVQSVPYSSSSLLQTVEAKLKLLKNSNSTAALQDEINDLVYAFCSDTADDDAVDDLIFSPDSCDLSVSNCKGVDLELSLDCIDDRKPADVSHLDTENVHMTCEDDGSTPDKCIAYYLHGYIAYRLKTFTRCDICRNSLVSANNGSGCSDTRLLLLKTHGGLQFPSQRLSSLLAMLESCVQIYASRITADMYDNILNDVLACNELQKLTIGCDVHNYTLTSRCIHFYIATRLHFINRSKNNQPISREEKRKHNKLSKLS